MRLTFLGTRGNIEVSTRRHRRHSALLIQLGDRRIMVDCGADWLGRMTGVAPDAIVLTHAHADHAEGLRQGAPCPVYAAAATWDLIGAYPIRRGRTVAPRIPMVIAGLTFCAYPVQRSLRCPAVGYRIGAGPVTLFYVPDVAAIPGHREVLAGAALYIGDGATITRPMLRHHDGLLLGHAPIRTQLGWCRDAGLRHAVFTHCGSEIVGGDERRLGARIRALARGCGVSARIAYDGLAIEVPLRRSAEPTTMPELPDVELYKRYLDQHALRQTIERVAVNDARILGDLSARKFVARLTGNRFENSRRHGKHLLVRLRRDGWLALHFGMTGNLVYFQDTADDPPYDRVRFDFEGGGHLAYVNRRMLGRVGLAEDADRFIEAEELGPDALAPAFDLEAFAQVIAGRRRDLKSVLMDQALMAGIGNIYADEILFQARLHPQTPVASLDEERRAVLFRQIKQVLETAIACGAGAEQLLERLPDDYLLPHRDRGGKCPRCGGPFATLKAAGRTSYYCPRCQPAPS